MNQSKQIAIEYVDARADFFCALADTIWENPELSLKEFGSTASYCAALRQLGFAVTEKLCGIDTAFCGSYGSGRSVIGILGETWYHVWYPDTGLSGWMKQDDLWPGNG